MVTRSAALRTASSGLLVGAVALCLSACGGHDHGASYEYGRSEFKIVKMGGGIFYQRCLSEVENAKPPIRHYDVGAAKAGCKDEANAEGLMGVGS